jgi:DNA-binding GntR family transcriptional regulator
MCVASRCERDDRGNSFMDGASEQVTQILEAVHAGDERAAEKLLPLVYDELRHLAAARMALEPPGQTIATDGIGARGLAPTGWVRQ